MIKLPKRPPTLQETKIRQSKREVGEADSARRILITDSQLFTEKMTLQENVKLEHAMGVDLRHHDQKHEVGLGWNQEDKGKNETGQRRHNVYVSSGLFQRSPSMFSSLHHFSCLFFPSALGLLAMPPCFQASAILHSPTPCVLPVFSICS